MKLIGSGVAVGCLNGGGPFVLTLLFMRVACDVVCRGITVVSAFEGYAFDAGMRVGDRLLSVDGVPVQGRSVDQVSGIGRLRLG